MIKILRTAAFLLCTAVAAPVMAQDFEKGQAAYNAGDYETALQEWRPLADQGDAGAQYNLGRMYDTGSGVLQGYAEAAGWYRLAAEQGHAEAQYALGSMYADGVGVIQDYAEAAGWVRLAAEQGHAEAKDGLIYLASEQGNASAQYALGSMYADGVGVIQDTFIAHMWFNISGANGHELGSAGRSLIEQRMTLEQIAEAQALARRCMASDYQDCG